MKDVGFVVTHYVATWSWELERRRVRGDVFVESSARRQYHWLVIDGIVTCYGDNVRLQLIDEHLPGSRDKRHVRHPLIVVAEARKLLLYAIIVFINMHILPLNAQTNVVPV